jgi:hypothetical protein
MRFRERVLDASVRASSTKRWMWRRNVEGEPSRGVRRGVGMDACCHAADVAVGFRTTGIAGQIRD